MTKIKIFLVVLACAVSMNLFSQKGNNWITYKTDNYLINYPHSWELNDNKEMGTEFYLFSPLDSEGDNFRDNVNLIIQDLSEYDLDLEQYIDITLSQIPTLFTDAKILANTALKDENGTEFTRLVYTGNQSSFKLNFEQYIWVINEMAYVITFTCEQEEVMYFKETSEAILKSFTLKL